MIGATAPTRAPGREVPASGRGAARHRSRAATTIASLALFTVVVPLGALVVATWLAGWQLRPLETGSMEPAYPTGALMVVSPVDPTSVRVGTPIVFVDPRRPGRLTAHRVVSRNPGDALSFRTQGDANNALDPYPVPARDIRGRVRWAIPGLGRAAQLLEWPSNAIVLVLAPFILLVASELRDGRQRIRRDRHVDPVAERSRCHTCQ